jgi:general secretion pathway protein G
MRRRASGFTLIELLIVIGIIGILVAIAIPSLQSAIHRGRQKRTMADMRSLATALESYAVDRNTYPAGSCAGGLFTSYGLAMNSTSLSAISPTYIANVPRIDGWGRPFLYNVNASKSSYNIVSYGRDGRASPSTPICGTTTNFNDDIIYSNGTFVQWPDGVQH